MRSISAQRACSVKVRSLYIATISAADGDLPVFVLISGQCFGRESIQPRHRPGGDESNIKASGGNEGSVIVRSKIQQVSGDCRIGGYPARRCRSRVVLVADSSLCKGSSSSNQGCAGKIHAHSFFFVPASLRLRSSDSHIHQDVQQVTTSEPVSIKGARWFCNLGP